MDKNTARQAHIPTVSIIMPVYNGERFLQQSLDSIYAQSFTDYEIVAIDDGSTDRTLELLQTNAAEHPNLRILHQTNHGQGYARNRGIEQARGEYILFVDADDWLNVEALKKLVAAVQGGADIVHCGWRASNLQGSDYQLVYRPSTQFATTELVGQACDEFLRIPNYFSVNNLYHRKFLTGHHIRFGESYIYEDNEFIVAAANRAQKIIFIDEPLYIINFHDSSSTRINVTTDKHYKGKISHMPFEKRKQLVEAIRYVDTVIPEDNWEQKRDDIQKHHVDVFVMGSDWEGKFDELKELCQVVYLSRTPMISSTSIKKIIAELEQVDNETS